MLTLIAGLALFIGAHAVRLVSETTRDALVSRLGHSPTKDWSHWCRSRVWCSW